MKPQAKLGYMKLYSVEQGRGAGVIAQQLNNWLQTRFWFSVLTWHITNAVSLALKAPTSSSCLHGWLHTCAYMDTLASKIK